jgi:ribosome-associated toxin RatA of RatAB toxin-antitoxin module
VAEQATEHTSVSAPPERCFSIVSDIERYPEWAADIKEVAVHDRDAEGRPLSVTFRAAAFGRSTSYTLAYDYSEAPRVLAWRLTHGDITTKLDGSYVFEAAEGGGTDITYHLEVELRVPIPGFIKMRAQSRIMATALRDLKARVESSA